MKPLLTVKEVADYLRVSEDHVRRWIWAGDLPAVRVGKRAVRVREEDLKELLKIAN